MKKNSIPYAEYKEYCSLIQKLCETLELFRGVNRQLIKSEKLKRGKGSWRSSNAMREATDLIDSVVSFF